MKTFLDDNACSVLELSLFFISSIVLIAYILFLIRINKIWKSSPKITSDKSNPSDITFSVIIAGRNEAGNLKNCIDSIFSNDYPKELYEIIYVDDHSEDESVRMLSEIKSENFRFFELSKNIKADKKNSYKKMAIDLGISNSRSEIILLTDADTITGKDWIRSHAEQYKADKNVKLCTGPVIYKCDASFIQFFQYYDLIATMGFTNAGIEHKKFYMANGANMSFSKEIYNSDTFGINLASGDDMFFVQQTAQKYPGSIRFIKSLMAAVFTFPESSFAAFINQRIRWGSKTKYYKDQNLKSILGFLFFVNFFVISGFLYGIVTMNSLSAIVVSIIIFKIFTEVILIKSLADKLKQKIDYLNLIISLLAYPFYLVFTGIISLFTSKYSWKGRIVK